MRWDSGSTICRPRRSWVWSHYWGSAVPRRRILLASDIVHGDEGAAEEPLSPVREKMVGLGFLIRLGRYEGGWRNGESFSSLAFCRRMGMKDERVFTWISTCIESNLAS